MLKMSWNWTNHNASIVLNIIIIIVIVWVKHSNVKFADILSSIYNQWKYAKIGNR